MNSKEAFPLHMRQRERCASEIKADIRKQLYLELAQSFGAPVGDAP